MTNINESEIVKTSKMLSLFLRHKPDSINLKLDKEGWANLEELIIKASDYGYRINLNLIMKVISKSIKKRFEISQNEKFIRAMHGHSTNIVDISYEEKVPPIILYHGTADRFLDSILGEGIISKERHYVHLTEDINTAQETGSRYGDPVVLEIDSLKMHQDGIKFFYARNGVWLTCHVPCRFFKKFSL